MPQPVVIKRTIKSIQCVPVFGLRLIRRTASRLGITDSRERLASFIRNITTIADIPSDPESLVNDCLTNAPGDLPAERRPIFAYRCMVENIGTECSRLGVMERAVQLDLALPANIQSIRGNTA